MPIDATLIKWLIETYGLPLVAVGFIAWKSLSKSDSKRDIAKELITKIDAIGEKVDKLDTVHTRLALIEYKVEELKK